MIDVPVWSHHDTDVYHAYVRQIATCIIWRSKATIYSTSDLKYKNNSSRQIRTPRDLDQY
jgi:hypothetical protein